MINICTLSDINYAHYALALFKSIDENTQSDFTFHYLCIDDESYKLFKSKNYDNIKVYGIQDLEQDEQFSTLKKNTTYSPMSYDVSNTYCFSLASYFSQYLFDHEKIEDIIYVDADVLFYNDIKDIHDFASQKSIGIMLHRHNRVGAEVGGYNVGLVYFKNDEVGYNCLNWWKNCVINPDNEWAGICGTCGDQKYLEAFEPLFGAENICVIDNEIGHGAPWNLALYNYQDDESGGEFLWKPRNGLRLIDSEEKKQKMYFIHFSQFNPKYDQGVFSFDRNRCWVDCNLHNNQHIINYYIDYFIQTHEAKKELE